MFGRHDTAEGDAPSGGRGHDGRPGDGTPSEVGIVAQIRNISILSVITRIHPFGTSTRVHIEIAGVSVRSRILFKIYIINNSTVTDERHGCSWKTSIYVCTRLRLLRI